MRLLTLPEVVELHRLIIEHTGGAPGLRDLGALQSALAQPMLTFESHDLYATLEEKAAALCFSLVLNHPFVDGNERVGHAALETMLVLNGTELTATVDDAERVMLDLAAGSMARDAFLACVLAHRANLDDLLVAWADKIWKGARAAELEDALAQTLARAAKIEPWAAFELLDDLATEIGKRADSRLEWQGRHALDPF